MNELKEAKAITVSCRQYASEIDLLDFLKRRGFTETSRVLDLRLDVAATDVSAFAPLRKRLNDEGISISTFADERARDPRCVAKHGDDYVGVSDVSLFEAVPGGLTQGFTGVKREYRRQGLATLLKVCGITYAE